MKEFVIRALAVLGLVPVRRYAAMARRVDAINHDLAVWRKRATHAAKHERDLAKQLQRQTKQLSKAHGAAAHLTSKLMAMQVRLVETEQALALTREHLMTIEVKLEILEGAANVLDARTRVALQPQPGKTDAAVS